MKRKVYYVIGAIVIVLAIAVALVFLFLTKDVEPAETDFKLDGTWRFFNCSTITADEQYIVFSDGIANVYNNGNKTASGFKYSDGCLELADLSFDCIVKKLSNNCLVLYDSADTQYTLVRSSWDETSVQNVDWNLLLGTWNVVIHGNGVITDEQMVFDATSMLVFRDGNTVPYLNSTYTIKEKGKLVADSIGLELNLCYLDSDLAILVESQTGYAYELARHK